MDCRSLARAASPRFPRAGAVAILMALVAANTGRAQLPVAELNTVFPPGGKQGTTFDVQLTGVALDGPAALLFSHAGISATPKLEPAGPLVKTPRPLDNQFTVSIASDTPPGIYEVRAVGRFGASNPRAFVVGSLDDIRDNGANRAPASAQEIAVGVVVSGTTEGDGVDYYRLSLKQGQRVLIDCWARRIDSRMDSTLVLFDDRGNELLRDRDTIGRDALLDFTAPADGAYLVGVYDFLYRGGAEYFYRLRAHTGPHVDAVFPPVVESGKPTKVTVYGRNLPGSKRDADFLWEGQPLESVEAEVVAPSEEQAQRQLAVTGLVKPNAASLDTFAWQFTSSNGAADPVPLAIAQAPVVVEHEPNDDPAQGNRVSAPCEFVGRFYPDNDHDWIEFEAKQGEVYWIEVIAHRAGLESDPYLLVQKVTKNDQGVEQTADVAQVDDPGDRNNRIGGDFDTSTDDPSWRFAADADAVYRIQVRDQFGSARVDPRIAYRLIIRRERPDFRLVAAPELAPTANANVVAQHAAVLRRGGTTNVVVRVERLDGFQGEVELSAEGLPPGVSCAGAVLGGSARESCLVFTADENAPAWSGAVRVVGKARIADQEVTRYARSGSLVWGTANRQQQPPIARMARDLVLSVMDKEAAPAFVQVGDGAVIESSKGGKVEIPLQVAWRGEFKGDLVLSPQGAPAEFQVKNFNVKPGQADAKLEFILNHANVQPGAYTFFLRGASKVGHDRNPDLIKDHEERQREIDQLIQELQARVKQAGEAKAKAAQTVVDAANLVKQKEQAAQGATPENAENANGELAQAREQLQAAEQAKAQAEEEERKATELAMQAGERKKQIDAQLNEVRKNNAKKDIDVFLASTPIKLRIAPDPIQPSAAGPVTVKAAAKAEVSVNVNRLYGFDDSVAVTLEPPSGISGIAAPPITIPKDQGAGTLEITAADTAPVGEHAMNLRFRVQFNNVQLDELVPLVVKVEAP